MGVAVSALLIDKRLLHNGVAHIVNFLSDNHTLQAASVLSSFFAAKKSSYILRTAVSISAKAGKTPSFVMSGELSDTFGEMFYIIAHSLVFNGRLTRAGNMTQIIGHRLMTRQKQDGLLFQFLTDIVDGLVVFAYLSRLRQIQAGKGLGTATN